MVAQFISRMSLLILAVFLWAWAALPCHASLGSEVVVVYNPREHGSEEIARHYANGRRVPEGQVLGLRMPVNEVVTRTQFTDEIERPIAQFLEAQNLWVLGGGTIDGFNDKPFTQVTKVVESKVRYLVLCRGVPLKIAGDPRLLENGGDQLRPELKRNEAAVDSELACLPMSRAAHRLSGPLRNPVYGLTNAAQIHPTNGVLMVSRLDGPTVEAAKQLVDKAREAETNGFWGRAYFDLRNPGDPGMQQGEDWIRAASDVTRVLGFETVVDERSATFGRGFPMSQIAVYAGWYTEHVDGPFLASEVEFMPGALAYHLHSFSAASLRTADRHWVGPLIAKGATISLGCVHEPYLGGTPDIGLLVTRLYYMGFSFGESAYAGQPVISWMTTVVGDPLFKPTRRSPQELHEELVMRRDPLRVWSQLRIVNLNLAKGLPKYQAVTYLEEIPATRQSAVLSEKLADLYSELGKPSSALRSWQAALGLDPTPQQRVRLQFKLGEKLVEAAREEEALAVYQQFISENPGHPEVVRICQKLVPVAVQLGRTNLVAQFQREMERLTGK